MTAFHNEVGAMFVFRLVVVIGFNPSIVRCIFFNKGY